MKIFRSMLIVSVLLLQFSIRGHENDTMTRIDNVPSQGVLGHIKDYASEHMWCMAIITGLCGYIYIQSMLDAMRPNPYEGPLAEAHAQIAELEAAIQKYEQVYRLLKPVLKYTTHE